VIKLSVFYVTDALHVTDMLHFCHVLQYVDINGPIVLHLCYNVSVTRHICNENVEKMYQNYRNVIQKCNMY
jgi:hypothetical protein